MAKALLVIDLQNDYFPGGKFPLWNTEAVLQNIGRAIEMAKAQGIPVIHVQHIADSKMGLLPSSTKERLVPIATLASLPPLQSLRLS